MSSSSTAGRNAPGRIRYFSPANFADQVQSSCNPLSPIGWFCLESCKILLPNQRVPQSAHSLSKSSVRPQNCCVCMGPGYKCCSTCKCVYYCSKECQVLHWKESHRKACMKNPHIYNIVHDLSAFDNLPQSCFVGHEFIAIEPHDQCESIGDLCRSGALRPADDLFDIWPTWGFEPTASKIPQNITRDLCRRFNFKSGYLSMGIANGYRMKENRFIYVIMYDDSFQSRTDLKVNYYGRAFFPKLEASKVRGTIVITKIQLVRRELLNPRVRDVKMQLVTTDDWDLDFSFEYYPSCLAEIAHMLHERMVAIEKGAQTSRMWRAEARAKEIDIEIASLNAAGANIIKFI